MTEGLREKARVLQAVMENVSEGVVVADTQGAFVSFNPAAERIVGLGMTPEPSTQWQAHYGVYLPDGVTPYPSDKFPLLRALRGEAVDNDEQFLRHPGRPEGVWISVSARALKDEAGKGIGAVAVFRDVTERKKAEADLIRSNWELEQFAYVASHDLQEPLRMVASYTKLLGDRYRGKLDKDADDFIGYAVDGALRMQKLIHGLLEYSRVGTKTGEAIPTESGAAAVEAVRNLSAAIEESGAKIELGPLPRVMGHPHLLVQLFQNLIGNALKFRGSEPARIRILSDLEPGLVRIIVEDNGIGIDPRYSDKIFGIFQRLHGRDQYPGTGIGLAVCKRIVERHEGRIWVESQVGRGSKFIFTLRPAGPDPQ